MKKTIKQIAFISGSLCYLTDKLSRFILSICLLSTLVILSYFVIVLINEQLEKIDKAIITGLIIAATSLITFVLSKLLEIRQQQITTLREHKAELYTKISKMFFDLLKSIRSDKPQIAIGKERDNIAEQIYTCNQDLIVWGSDDVVKKFISYRENVKNPNTIFTSIGDLFISIRKDLGHKNRGLNNKNILKIFVNSEEVDKSK